MSKSLKQTKKVLRKIPPVRKPKHIEVKFRKILLKLIEPMLKHMTVNVASIDGTDISAILNMLKRFRVEWGGLFGSQAQQIADEWSMAVTQESKNRLEKSLANVLGIDRYQIVDNPKMIEQIVANSEEVYQIVKSIPDEYVGRISQAVVRQARGQAIDGDMTLSQLIRHVSGVSKKRAGEIARIQTSKMNATINMERQKSIGIEEYIWRTSEDSRVVGNPAGWYPKGNKNHGNHFERNGKIFRWDDPPEDGHPGMAINCRCSAIPVIDRDLLVKHNNGTYSITGLGVNTNAVSKPK